MNIEFSLAEWFGIIAAAIQFAGYLYYFKYIKLNKIDPNPVTWFMLAYGTALLTVLEWDASASWALLALPTTCTLSTLGVSGWCWYTARIKDPSRWWPEDWWPQDKSEQGSFITDILITIGYVSAGVLAASGYLPDSQKLIVVLTFLWLANASTITSMLPLMRETKLHPEREHWMPWAVWTLAYAALTIATILDKHESPSIFYALIAYPIINVVVHMLVAWWSRKSPINVVL